MEVLHQRPHVVSVSVEGVGIGLRQSRENFLRILLYGSFLILDEVPSLHCVEENVPGLAQHYLATLDGAQLYALTL
ncbi:hypothetical protein D3C76_1811930 [compost metagenome]